MPLKRFECSSNVLTSHLHACMHPSIFIYQCSADLYVKTGLFGTADLDTRIDTLIDVKNMQENYKNIRKLQIIKT